MRAMIVHTMHARANPMLIACTCDIKAAERTQSMAVMRRTGGCVICACVINVAGTALCTQCTPRTHSAEDALEAMRLTEKSRKQRAALTDRLRDAAQEGHTDQVQSVCP